LSVEQQIAFRRSDSITILRIARLELELAARLWTSTSSMARDFVYFLIPLTFALHIVRIENVAQLRPVRSQQMRKFLPSSTEITRRVTGDRRGFRKGMNHCHGATQRLQRTSARQARLVYIHASQLRVRLKYSRLLLAASRRRIVAGHASLEEYPEDCVAERSYYRKLFERDKDER